MIKGIHHVTLVVQNLEAAQLYYCAVAGMKCLADDNARALTPASDDPDCPPARHSLLAGRNGYLELVAPHWSLSPPPAVGNPINRPGIRHFCAQNFDCRALEEAVTGNGGSLIAPPLDLGTGNQYAYARDCEGNIMEIEGLPYAPQGEATWLGHVAVVTQNMGRAVSFYSGLCGSALQNRGHFGPGPQFDRMGGLVGARLEGAWLQTGNMSLELWQFHAPQYPPEASKRQSSDPGFTQLCFETDDLEADLNKIEGLGGRLLSECVENDQARTVLASDPEGNTLKLLEFRDAASPLSIAALDDPGICARVEARR